VILLDTNVLVYAHDPSQAKKYARAVAVLDGLTTNWVGCVSTQTLGEFVWATTRKRGARLSLDEALAQAEAFAASWTVLDVTGAVVREAIRGVRAHRLSYWDAQLWATARMNQVPVILSEDLTDGATLDGVAIINPFAEGFSLASLLS
jgi:predicted nucleic acid-binding protein